MRYLIIIKATKDSEAGVLPGQELIAEMAEYHGQLAKAGILLDASGLQLSAKGWCIGYSGSKRTVIDGPFTEAKELIAGYPRCGSGRNVSSNIESAAGKCKLTSFHFT